MRSLKVGFSIFCFFLALGGGVALASPTEVMGLKVRADHLLKRGRIDRAISLYGKVLEKDEGFAHARYNLATAYYLGGQLEKAADHLEAFLELRPRDAEALYNLGCLKIRLGALDEAWKCFFRAEDCPCTRIISRKIKEALHFMKDLKTKNQETQQLVAYLASGLIPNPSTA